MGFSFNLALVRLGWNCKRAIKALMQMKGFIFLLCFCSWGARAQIYSFENGLLPAGWSITSGTLQVTNNKFKLGTNSLSWTWNAGATLTVTNPSGLTAASTTNSGGIYLWIYNPTPSTTNLVFSFLNTANQVKCHADFNLNFHGWRCLNAAFVNDMGHDKSLLTQMRVQAPAAGGGTFYFDYVEFQNSIAWDRASDAQYQVKQSSAIVDFWGIRSNGNFGAVSTATAAQIAGAATIAQRLDNWYLSTRKYPANTSFLSRSNAVKNQINYALTHNTNDFTLSVAGDGTVKGVGLFPAYAASTIDGVAVRQFLDVMTGCLLPLAYDYRLYRTTLSSNRWINVLDWFYDQGWADGSAMGGNRFEKLRSAGYFHSVFLMRNALDTNRLSRELGTLDWMGLYGNANMPFTVPGENADQLRTMCIAKLAFALMQPDPDKRVAALCTLTNYFNNAFASSPGFAETFKPDYSGYHHNGIYNTEYYPDALYSAAWVYYLLHDTPYALSDSVFLQLKNCLLTYRLVASVYDVPVATCGRFPFGTEYMDNTLPAFAYLALSKTPPDPELLAAFSRLWQPSVSPLKDYITNASTGITLRTTLGEIECCLDAAALNVPPEASPQTSLYLPYSGLLVQRLPTSHVSLKGFSKYIWDYESDTSNNNPFGRYLSYGQLEYTDLVTGKGNNSYTNGAWDWARIPGTTTLHQPTNAYIYTSSTPYRNFSDSTFLGGLALNQATCLFSMQLHDNAFEKTFYANKSVFCFSNALVCLGSNLRNSGSVRTETTLLQQALGTGENLKINGTNVTASLTGLTRPVIRDNLGNRFIVRNGSVDVVKSNTVYSAVINHGIAPADQSYLYYMLLQGSDAQEAQYSNAVTCPITVLRQDNVAHIVAKTNENVWAYAIFDASTALNDTWIKQVNIPSLAMFQATGGSGYNLVVSDPDMHRPGAANTDTGLTTAIQNTPSAPFNYQITLNGTFHLAAGVSGVTLTNAGTTTQLGLTVIDGRTYAVGLIREPDSPPKFTSIVPQGTKLTLQVSNGINSAGLTYFLLSSTNLSQITNPWSIIATGICGSTPSFTITSTVPANTPTRFYRLSFP